MICKECADKLIRIIESIAYPEKIQVGKIPKSKKCECRIEEILIALYNNINWNGYISYNICQTD